MSRIQVPSIESAAGTGGTIDDTQCVETTLAVAVTVCTNVFNLINDTASDFAAVS